MERLTFSPDFPDAFQTVSLGGTSYRIRSVWRERSRSWYLDVYLADGTGIALGRRVAASGILVRDLARTDANATYGGVLFAAGKDRYAREDLGVEGGINVYFATRAEWDEAFAIDTSEDVLIT